MIEVVSYRSEDGKNRFDDWMASLDRQAFNKVFAAITRMEQGNLGDFKSVGDGVSERRIDWGPGYRVYCGRDGKELILLLAGGIKRTQSKDITTAKKLWEEYKKSKKKG